MFVGPGDEFGSGGLAERLVDWEFRWCQRVFLAQRFDEFSPHPVRAIEELRNTVY